MLFIKYKVFGGVESVLPKTYSAGAQFLQLHLHGNPGPCLRCRGASLYAILLFFIIQCHFNV